MFALALQASLNVTSIFKCNAFQMQEFLVIIRHDLQIHISYFNNFLCRRYLDNMVCKMICPQLTLRGGEALVRVVRVITRLYGYEDDPMMGGVEPAVAV